MFSSQKVSQLSLLQSTQLFAEADSTTIQAQIRAHHMCCSGCDTLIRSTLHCLQPFRNLRVPTVQHTVR